MKRLFRWLVVVPILALLWLPISFANEYTWELVEELIARKFPNTPTIGIEEFLQWKETKKITVIDVRTKEEFVVGHIQYAQNIETLDDVKKHISPEEKVVFYCSVGYRSAKIVQELRKQGYVDVYNLKGSIFAWANAENSIYRGNELVHTVHPYNASWGKLLQKKYHAYQ